MEVPRVRGRRCSTRNGTQSMQLLFPRLKAQYRRGSRETGRAAGNCSVHSRTDAQVHSGHCNGKLKATASPSQTKSQQDGKWHEASQLMRNCGRLLASGRESVFWLHVAPGNFSTSCTQEYLSSTNWSWWINTKKKIEVRWAKKGGETWVELGGHVTDYGQNICENLK